jgi:hypothetical protein
MRTINPIFRRPALWAFLILTVLFTIGFYLERTPTILPVPSAPLPLKNPPPSTPLTYTRPDADRTLVVAKLREDDTSWVDRAVKEDPHLRGAVYTVDDKNAALTVPKNKGHEVMVYLTYIIDHYTELSDVSIFMHAHEITWHNNDFLNSNSSLTVLRLKKEHVLQNGYMNLRCHQNPGCPDHIHPTVSGDAGENNDLANIPEAAVIGNSWLELFPGEQIPSVLSQPCCGQFAVSAERIRKVELSSYVAYRDWLLDTPLEDSLSGRVWEYVWQFLFTGQWEFCPEETHCYCEGYGICFEGTDYTDYFDLRTESRKFEAEIREFPADDETEATKLKLSSLHTSIDAKQKEMSKIKSKALG